MPFIELNGGRIHYHIDGPGEAFPDAPVLVLSHSLGTNLSMWDHQAAPLARRFRVLRYDTSGHGASSAPPGPYSIEQLGGDAVRLLDELKIDRAHFCGLSVGGMIGMWLGAAAPERLNKLVLANTAPRIGTAEAWNARIAIVREKGLEPVAASVVERWFSPAFKAQNPGAVETARAMLLQSSRVGYTGCCAALRDTDLSETIRQVRAKTLVIAGSHDPATTPADGHFIAGQLEGARYVELNAAHLSNIEAAQEFTEAVLEFLAEPEAN